MNNCCTARVLYAGGYLCDNLAVSDGESLLSRHALFPPRCFPVSAMSGSRSVSKTPLVIALLSTQHKAHRDKLQGIFEYAQKARWRLEVAENNPFGFSVVSAADFRHCDGLIVDDATAHGEIDFRKVVPPLVMIDPEPPYAGKFCEVRLDSNAIGRLAAQTLLTEHFDSYAFVPSMPATRWSNERGRAFRATINEAGAPFFMMPDSVAETDWTHRREALARWLETLPRPCGVFAAMDACGKFVLEACQRAQIDVPAGISVLGVDNHEIVCESIFPTLSSIMPDFVGCGRLAAEMLDNLMQNGKPEKPVGRKYGAGIVVERRSTGRMHPNCDVRVMRGLEYIRKHACDGVRVEDVAREMGVSRRTAELLFKPLGRTIARAITDARLDQVRKLLLSTNLRIGEIADQTGFCSDVYLAELFRSRFGETMRAYRQRGRENAAPGKMPEDR